MTPEAILLTAIYSKSDRRNISNKEIEDIIGEYELEIDALEERISEQEAETIITESEDSDSVG